MPNHHKINYIEFPAIDIDATKAFFMKAFGWNFKDYGPDYTCFIGHGTDGGFYRSDLKSSKAAGAALVVLYSNNLEETASLVKEAGGKINVDIFKFPGGRWFHFTEPSGNELAVWSE
ncbi:MAG: VOC family protein [Emcibacter sp.]|nr:VOC family protein [Emcibacter sp.]